MRSRSSWLRGIRWPIGIGFLTGVALILLAAPAVSTASERGSRPEARCKFVIKTIHGHRRRVKVCRPKPKPRPPVKPSADLSVAITPSLEHVTAGNVVGYTIVVQNHGPATAPGVVLTVETSGLVGFSGLFSAAHCSGLASALTCQLGKLRPVGSEEGGFDPRTAVINVVTEPETAGSFPFVARVKSAATRDPHPANNQGRVTTDVSAGPPSADLSISVRSTPDPAFVAEDFTDTISITNDGPTEATIASVTLLLPQGARLVDFDGIPSPSGACSPFEFSGLAALTFCWGAIESGQTVTVTLTLEPMPSGPGTLETNALVSSYTPDPDLANNRATAVARLTPFRPSPGVDLIVTLVPPTSAHAGKDFELGFRVANHGAEAARDVQFKLTSPFSGGSSLSISAPDAVNCSPTESSWTCTIPTLASGTRMIGSVSGFVSSPGSFSATLTASSAATDSDPSDNTATSTFEIIGRP